MDLTQRQVEISNMPKRSRKLLPLSEKVKIIDSIRKDKKSSSQVSKICGENESSIRQVVKNKKAIRQVEISNMPKRPRKLLPLSEKVKIHDSIRKGKKSSSQVAEVCGENESSIRQVVKNKKTIRQVEISNTPKRPRKLLPLSEKVKILDLVRKDKKSYSQVAKIYGKNESSIRQIVKNEKAIRSSVAILPRTFNATSTVRNKYLVKTEQALNLWVREMNKKCVPIDGNVIRQKAVMLYKDFHRESPASNLSKPFTASKGWLHRFLHRFGLKNVKVSRDSTSHVENIAEISTGRKKLLKKSQKSANCSETDLSWETLPRTTYVHTAPQIYEEDEVINSCDVTELSWENIPDLTYADTAIQECVDDSVSLGESDDENTDYQVRKSLWDDFETIMIKPSSKKVKRTKDKPTAWTLDKVSEVFHLAQILKDKIINYDPVVERSIRITNLITEALKPLQQHFDELQSKEY
ncbi:HTH CENPB-type domain-containing protein [Trichonephila inaurata madagascariensis]|uniref:HTH CENPB-type domain-containing protein n=1 Tax=Trichonephila inaurata madagascariensis TaxID=2747483 RepID=A0A8X6XX94_9ARAC|nr:HTH CENPB-type domain-containing protein [Trichonephila inaurata madagascariensis]